MWVQILESWMTGFCVSLTFGAVISSEPSQISSICLLVQHFKNLLCEIWNCPPTQKVRRDWKQRDQSRLASSRFNKQADLHLRLVFSSVQFSSVSHSCPMLCDPMDCSTSGLPVHHQLLEHTQTHVHRDDDDIQPSHPLLSPSPPAPNPSKHQGLFQWVSSLHQVAKVLEFQLQHQSFQWTPRTDL